MINLPSYVKPGTPLKSSWANDVATSFRERPYNKRGGERSDAKVYRPFDPIYLDYKGGKWVMKLQEAWVIKDNIPFLIYVTDINSNRVDLLGNPEIEVELDVDKYLVLQETEEDYELNWFVKGEEGDDPIILSVSKRELLPGEEPGDNDNEFSIFNSYPQMPIIDSSNSGFSFCKLVSISHDPSPSTKGIAGGLITCGDKNFNAPDFDLDGLATGTHLVYIELPCEVNRDDDNEILLPQVKTSSKTSLTSTDWKTTTAASYPDTTNPDVSDGLGTAIIPIGKIVKSSTGTYTFSPVACGARYVNHCAGSIYIN